MDSDSAPVAWYESLVEAELARSRLEAEGLAAWVADTSVLGTGWCHPGQRGGIVLMTLESDAEEARALLDAIEAAYEPEIPEEYALQAGNEVCPECGSPDKRFERQRTVELVAEILISKHVRGKTGPRWRCRQCGHRWQAEPAPTRGCETVKGR